MVSDLQSQEAVENLDGSGRMGPVHAQVRHSRGDRGRPPCRRCAAVPRHGDEPRGERAGGVGTSYSAPRGRPAVDAAPGGGPGCRAPPTRPAARLHERCRAAIAPTTAGRPLRRRRHRPGPGGGRRVGRIHARVPDHVRARRPSRRDRAGLSLLPQRPDRSRHDPGGDSGRSRHPLGSDPRTSRSGRRSRAAWCWRHRRIRPARS